MTVCTDVAGGTANAGKRSSVSPHAINGARLVIDYTTAKDAYPEKALQITAYRNATHVVTNDFQLHPMPVTDGGAILHLTDDGYRLLPVDTGEQMWDAFKFVREMFHWVNEVAPKAIGRAVRPSVAPFAPDLTAVGQ